MHTRTTKATKYSDLETIYSQCGGPGGLELAEFMAEKMQLQAAAWYHQCTDKKG